MRTMSVAAVIATVAAALHAEPIDDYLKSLRGFSGPTDRTDRAARLRAVGVRPPERLVSAGRLLGLSGVQGGRSRQGARARAARAGARS
jgi:hypothetical protein